MKRNTKVISIILTMVMLLAVLATAVSAAVGDYTKTKGSLKLTKYEKYTDSQGHEQQKVLAGVTFDIYKVDDNSTSTTPSGAKTATKTTGEDGIAKFDDLALGRYLVVESAAPENVVDRIANFLVDIPMTNATGDGLIYDVELSPKNTTAYGAFTLVNKGEESANLKGVTYILQKQSGAHWEDYKTGLGTDDNGTISLTGLPQAKYRLIQTSIGDNTDYILDNQTAHEFTVTRESNGSTKVEPSQINVTNEKLSVAKTTTAVTRPAANTNTVKDGVNSADVGDKISFQIVADVPQQTIARLATYKITDTMAEGLNLDSSSVHVYGTKTGVDTELTGEDITLTPAANSFELTFKNATLAAYESVKVTYDATFATNTTTHPTNYDNTAKLEYSNIVTTKYDNTANTQAISTMTSSTTLKTGGFKIEKHANTADGALLPNAEFKLALSIADAEAGTFIKDSNGNEIKLTTDTQGAAEYYGLTFGTYQLIETKAPVDDQGISYNSLNKPVELTINGDSYATAIKVVNKQGTVLPGTGGIGAIIFIVVGVLALGTGVTLHIKNKNN